jgi:hypothetical protein
MKIDFKIPNSWNELSDTQLQRIALLFHTVKPSIKFDLQILYILLNIQWWQFRQKAKVRIGLRNFPLSDLRKTYDFIYCKNDRTKFPEFLKLKTENRKQKTLFPPQDRIANFTADEFSVADDLHIKWRETKNLEFLHYLTAILYSPTKNRPTFDKNELHDKALLFSKVPLKELLAIEMAYFGCKNHIVKRFPKAFPKAQPGASKPKKNYGFGKVILSMTRGDLSKLEIIKKVNLYAFLEQFEEDLTPIKK